MVWYSTLFDSGSDGDLVFVVKQQLDMIPQVKKHVAKEWSTSTGNFVTKYAGVLELVFPEFSKSKFFFCELQYCHSSKKQKASLQYYIGCRNPSTIWFTTIF